VRLTKREQITVFWHFHEERPWCKQSLQDWTKFQLARV
jgi:hypothetical protein